MEKYILRIDRTDSLGVIYSTAIRRIVELILTAS